MAQIDRIVEVYISRKTAQIDIRAFDIPLLLVKYDGVKELKRVADYTSLEGVLEDFGVDSPAYKKVVKLLGGDVRPREFKIGIVKDGETYVQALNEVLAYDDSWYIVTTDTHEDDDILAMAEVIQAMEKLYFTSSSSADILDPNKEDDVASQLSDAGYDHTVILYSENADTQFPEDAWVGGQIAKVVGSYTWEYKKLAGVTVSRKLSDNDIATLENKGCNYYITVKGASITRRGKTSEGAWADELQISHWLKARLQEQIFYRLINSDKIPYTNVGAAMVEAEMRQVFAIAQANDAIDTYTLQVPNVYEIPEMQRAKRELGDFKFEARLAGAVSTVIIRGTLTA